MERLEGGPVSSRVSTFPDVFSVAKGGPKCVEGGGKPWVSWRLAPGEFLKMAACLSRREDRVVL